MPIIFTFEFLLSRILVRAHPGVMHFVAGWSGGQGPRAAIRRRTADFGVHEEISETTRAWMQQYDFMLVCKKKCDLQTSTNGSTKVRAKR
jgi:hypothetical protein